MLQLKLFRNEVKILKHLNHPNILKYQAYIITTNVLVIITDLYENKLSDILKRIRCPSEK